MENNWGGEGQSGIGVLFTVRNQEGSAPYSLVKDTVFINNIVKNCDGGALNFLGTDNEKPSQKALNAVIRNNVFDQIKGTFLTINGYDNVTIERNTHLQSGNTMMFYGGIVSQGFIYRDNVTIEKPYGIRDETGSFEGAAAITKWTPGGVFSGNVIASPYTTNPPGNDYPASLTIGADYRHSYVGKGADVDVLMAAQSGASSPTPTPEPTPVPQPTPTPVPTPATKTVAWPKQEGKQTTVLNTQWAERYRLKDTNVSGDFAIFEKVG